MPPDSTGLFKLMGMSQADFYNFIMLILTIIGTVATVIGTVVAVRSVRSKREVKRIQSALSRQSASNFFPSEAIASAIRYYVPPDISTDNPTHDDKGVDKLSREPLFEAIDKFLAVDSPFHHLYVFGDSGTGKTSFVLNYYARNYQLPEQKQQKIVIIPLGMPDAEKYIADIKDQEKTAIFLDAFDEDTEAITRTEQRFARLIDFCRKFRRVLITSRSQFFPNDAAIQRKTGIRRYDPLAAGQSAEWEFSTLYLMPLSDQQVGDYLSRRYSIWRYRTRRKAFQLVKKIPTLALRPMLLSYVPDLLNNDITFRYTFQLYEAMVEAWLKREEYFVKDKKALRDFSEYLAVDLYGNREKRGAEWIHKNELAPFARRWHIKLEEWKLRSRSLLTHGDTSGHYKFAHRSIMEYLFVKRLIDGDDACRKLKRTDQMNTFLMEMLKSRGNSFTIPKQQDLRRYPLQLRSTSIENLQEGDVESMINSLGYSDQRMQHKKGQGLIHLYDSFIKDDAKVVSDYATGLMWQQSGSPKELNSASVQKYIRKLNNQKFAGYNDWRLPTLEEAMSLMEPAKKNGDLYIDPVFDKTQRFIWTADKQPKGVAWYVNFPWGECFKPDVIGDLYVRAVRSGQSTI